MTTSAPAPAPPLAPLLSPPALHLNTTPLHPTALSGATLRCLIGIIIFASATVGHQRTVPSIRHLPSRDSSAPNPRPVFLPRSSSPPAPAPSPNLCCSVGGQSKRRITRGRMEWKERMWSLDKSRNNGRENGTTEEVRGQMWRTPPERRLLAC